MDTDGAAQSGAIELDTNGAAQSGATQAEEFMAIAAHDLRNPIAVVRASAQMAQRQIQRGDEEAARGRLAAIVEQTDRLTEMLETFLDAARIGAGRVPVQRERLDVRDVVDEALRHARLLAPGQVSREMTTDIPDGCIGSWDRLRVVRALRALVSNAMLYGDPGAPVSVVGERNGNRVRLAISGGGAGPDDEESAHLFERFFRGRSAAEAGQAGSGLGLFVARGIARLHDGDVRRREGDTFELELPLLDP